MQTNAQKPIRFSSTIAGLFSSLARLWPLMLAIVLACSGLNTIRSWLSYVPQYESKAIFTVSSGYTGDDIFGASAYYDMYAAQQLAAAFPQILSTDMMNDLVVERLDKGYINGVASAYAVADTNMLVLTVRSTVPEDAYDYLNAVIECYPQVAVYIVDNPQVKIMQSPQVPAEPCDQFSPWISAVKGGLIGVVLAAIVLLALSLPRRTIQSADDLKSAVNLPILVSLPRVTQKKRRKNASTTITASSDPDMAECIRGLRLKVKKLLEDKEQKTVLVTSTLPREGKSTVAVNLAKSLVREGHSVVLLDGDLRNQSVARMLGQPSQGQGLLECLKDPDLSVLSCVRTDPKSKLCFISGQSTSQRHYSIEHRAMRRILDTLAQHFEYVVIDTPPSEVVSDTSALCRYASCVLYVVKQDHTQRGQIINAVTALTQKDVKIDGCVFNAVPQRHRQYGYGYRTGYSYGYRKYGYHNKYSYGYSKYKAAEEE